MLLRIFTILLLLSLPAFAEWDAETQSRFNQQGKADLRRAHASMAKAVQASVYLLEGDDEPEGPRKARTFPIKPDGYDKPIQKERILKGIELQLLQKSWGALADEDYYMQMRCHFPIYGLRFRDVKGHVLFQTSVCLACSNYYVQRKDGYTWAALPMRHLPESDFQKLLDGLFKRPSK